jgi:hypothetical protein
LVQLLAALSSGSVGSFFPAHTFGANQARHDYEETLRQIAKLEPDLLGRDPSPAQYSVLRIKHHPQRWAIN